MDKVKAQHYVPRSYLKRFTVEKDTICVFDKFDKRFYKSNIKNVAQERFFNDDLENLNPNDDVDLQFIEKAYGWIESNFHANIENLLPNIENRRIILSEKEIITLFVAAQVLRTREARNDFIEFHIEMKQMLIDTAYQEFNSQYPDHPSVAPKYIFNPELEATIHNQCVFDNGLLFNICNVIHNHIFIVGVNKSKTPFITSDHPLVRFPHIKSEIQSFSGLGSNLNVDYWT